MPLQEPVLTKRIPTPPFGDFSQRKLISYEDFVATGGYVGLKKAIDMQPSDIIDTMKASELRGRGGAGFPAGVKWSFLPPQDGKPRYLAVNSDESEPGTFKDRMLLDFDPHILLEGIAICMRACQLDTTYIYIR
ncbi:MAG TPA: hypothetical protein DER01_04845, partial [Phycisphaerales bacterium]|nr:hypothetical protein [Phycisphaerales bacterium]